MNIIYGGRGCGKTAELIKMSARDQIYILVTDHKRADILAQQARDMGITDMPYPAIMTDLCRNTHIKKMLIDDLDAILHQVFPFQKIEAVTIRSDENLFNKSMWETENNGER